MAEDRRQHHYHADDDRSGGCRQCLLHAVQRSWPDQLSDLDDYRTYMRMCLAGGSQLGVAPHYALRDLAMDAADVPAGANWLDESAREPDPCCLCARRVAHADLPACHAAATHAGDHYRAARAQHRNFQDLRSRLRPDARRPRRGDRNYLDVHVQRRLRLFSHRLHRSRRADDSRRRRRYLFCLVPPAPAASPVATNMFGEDKAWARWLKRTAACIAIVIAFFPIFWLISTSFKPIDEWQKYPPVWISSQPTLQNYRIVFAPQAAQEFAAKQQGAISYKGFGKA